MGLFSRKTRVSDFFSEADIQAVQAAAEPQIIALLMDFNSRTLYEAFMRAGGDTKKKLDRAGVSRLLSAAEEFAKADPDSAAPLKNGIGKMKSWLDDPSNR